MGLRDLFRNQSPGEAATAVILVAPQRSEDPGSSRGRSPLDEKSVPRVDPLSLVQKQRARGRTVVRRESQSGTLALAIDDRQVLIKTLDQAYPPTELASFLRGTWWWPDAIETAREHAGRILVHVPVAAGDPRDRHLLATSLVEDILGDDAVAVLWSGTGAIVPPDRFIELARDASRTQLPITLWISVRFASVGGERIAFTTGMSAFGLPEIESAAGDGDPSPLATAIFEAVHDLLVSGEHADLKEAASKIHPKTKCLVL